MKSSLFFQNYHFFCNKYFYNIRQGLEKAGYSPAFSKMSDVKEEFALIDRNLLPLHRFRRTFRHIKLQHAVLVACGDLIRADISYVEASGKTAVSAFLADIIILFVLVFLIMFG